MPQLLSWCRSVTVVFLVLYFHDCGLGVVVSQLLSWCCCVTVVVLVLSESNLT